MQTVNLFWEDCNIANPSWDRQLACKQSCCVCPAWGLSSWSGTK